MKSKYFNKAILLLTVAVAIGLGGCKKYLDQQPITSVGPDQVFKDVPTTFQALAGVYGRLTGNDGYGLKLSLYYPVDNDILMGPNGNNDDRRALAHFVLTSLNSDLSGPFNQLFEGIMLANVCIDQIPKMDMYSGGSDQEKKQLQRMYGEALALRAQFYFEAIRNWGDLPTHFQPSYVEAVENPYPQRADRDIIYNKILEDLKLAVTLVPWRNEVTGIGDQIDERLTKGAVKALRAKIALACGGYSLRQDGSTKRPDNYLSFYQIARDETNEIINSGQHALYPDYKGLWKDIVCAHKSVDPNGELMFQTTGIGGGGTADTKFGYSNGPRVNGLGNSFVNPLPNYFYLFDSADKRRDVTIAPYDVAADGITKIGQPITNMRDGKYRRDWISNPVIPPSSQVQYFGLNWQIIRYSDVLLMFAEAENEINGPAGAYNAINMVRRRGFGKPVSAANAAVDIPAGLGKSDFFKYLVRERALELGAEGIRKYDLKRWNLLGKGLKEANEAMTIMAGGSGVVTYSYMAGPPAYAADVANLPTSVYLKPGAQGDDASIWANSFYEPLPSPVPAGTKISWVSTPILSSIVTSSTRYAFGYTEGKSDLLPIPQTARDANPNLTQNPKY